MWGFKDPRCVLTLDFWREAIPELRFVATYRHLADVASSLASRERIEVKTGDQARVGFLTAQMRSPGVRTTGDLASNRGKGSEAAEAEEG